MIYHFHDCELDDRVYQLRRDGTLVELEPKVFHVLTYLLHHRDRVVSTVELREKLWPKRVISADALTRCIVAARKAVGDDGGKQQIIKTQHSLGYRFVAPVTEQAEKRAGGPDELGVTFQPAPSDSLTLNRSKGKRVLVLPDKPSIAVLPFTNLSGDPSQEHFSDGITEDVITDLSKLSGLFVIARHTIFAYRGRAMTLEDVSRALGVRYVLEGSVRKANDWVRITTQLVDTSTTHLLWAERYDRKLTDLFALQDEIAGCIVTALQMKFKEAERAPAALGHG